MNNRRQKEKEEKSVNTGDLQYYFFLLFCIKNNSKNEKEGWSESEHQIVNQSAIQYLNIITYQVYRIHERSSRKKLPIGRGNKYNRLNKQISKSFVICNYITYSIWVNPSQVYQFRKPSYRHPMLEYL